MSQFRTLSARLTGSMLLAVATFLTGCGMGHISTTESSAAFQGKVFGGQQPIGQSTITVWQAGITGYGSAAIQLAQVTSDDNGNFSFPANAYTCTDPTTQVYITAAGGDPTPGNANPNVLLAAGLGNCSTAQTQFVVINEVTTAATAFALSHFFTTTFGAASNNSFGTSAGDLPYFTLSNTNTIPMLVDLPSGTSLPSSNGITREDTRLNTIANILAACVNDSSSFSLCTRLFTDTTDSNGNVPSNTLQAAVMMALYPSQNVDDLYGMQTGTAPFIGISTEPTDWTLGIAYTSSNFGFSATPALPSGAGTSIDIDSNGRVFFPSNAPAQTGIGYFDPSAGAFGALQLANQLIDPQYLAVDTDNEIFISDIGSPNLGVLSPDFSMAQTGPIASDAVSSGPLAVVIPIVVTSYVSTGGSNEVTLLESFGENDNIGLLTQPPNGLAIDTSIIYAMTSGVGTPCALEELDTAAGTTWTHTTDVSTGSNCQSGGMISLGLANAGYGLTTTDNQVCISALESCQPVPVFDNPISLAADGDTSAWVTNSANHSVAFSAGILDASYVHPTTLPQPYGLAIDGSGNVWVSNAGCISTTITPCTPGPFTLTELVGAGAPTVTPLSAQTLNQLTGTRPQATHSSPTATNSFFGHQTLNTSATKTFVPWLNR